MMTATRNDITGGVLANVKGDGNAFREGHERIFGQRKREQYVPPPLPQIEPIAQSEKLGHH